MYDRCIRMMGVGVSGRRGAGGMQGCSCVVVWGVCRNRMSRWCGGSSRGVGM